MGEPAHVLAAIVMSPVTPIRYVVISFKEKWFPEQTAQFPGGGRRLIASFDDDPMEYYLSTMRRMAMRRQ